MNLDEATQNLSILVYSEEEAFSNGAIGMIIWIRKFVRLGLFTFFRELEVNGIENVPTDRGGIVIAWHPNGMVDPALIFSTFPQQLMFGARHGLFRVAYDVGLDHAASWYSSDLSSSGFKGDVCRGTTCPKISRVSMRCQSV